MATNTTNYNWTKPDYEDDADIKDLNDNFDSIDAQVKAIDDQVQLNKNNILFVNQKVGVNLVNSASGSGTRWINVEVDLPAGTYTCGFSSLTGDDSGVSQVTFYGADYAIIQPERSQISKGNNVYINNIVVTGTVKTIRIYAASDSTTSQNKGVSYTNLFVCKQEAWGASVGVQPYAMSNAELTNNILNLKTMGQYTMNGAYNSETGRTTFDALFRNALDSLGLDTSQTHHYMAYIYTDTVSPTAEILIQYGTYKHGDSITHSAVYSSKITFYADNNQGTLVVSGATAPVKATLRYLD